MEIIYRSRGQGKTTDLIKMSAKNGYCLVCSTMNQVQWVWNHARAHDLDIPFPITFGEFINHQYHGKGVKGFLIDDADQLLQYMSSVPVFAVAMTDDSKQTKRCESE